MKKRQTKSSQKQQAAKPVINKTTSKKISSKQATAVPSLAINQYLDKWSAALFFVLLFTLLIYIFRAFLSKEWVFLFKDIGSDSLNVYYPVWKFAEFLKDTGQTLDGWSMYEGMGAPSGSKQAWYAQIVHLPMVLLYLPFQWLGYLFGFDRLPFSIIWNQFTQLSLIGIFSFLYLRSLNMSKYSVLIGGLMFSFSGYVILGSTWYHSAFTLVFMLFGFEQWFSKKRWYFFVYAFVLVGGYNYYIYGLFLAVYALARYFWTYPFDPKKTLTFFAQSVGLVFAGVLINLSGTLEWLQGFFNSPRGESVLDSEQVTDAAVSYAAKLSDFPMFGTESAWHNITAVMRLFSNDILGNGSYFNGWNNYLEAPALYAGLLALLIIPQLFVWANKRGRIAIGSFLSVWIIVVSFPFFRYAFYFFMGDYYKAGISYFIPISLVFLTVLAIHYLYQEERKINWYVLGASLVAWLLILYKLPLQEVTIQGSARILQIDESIQSAVRNFLVVYAILLALFNFKATRAYAPVLLILVVVIELGYMGNKTIEPRGAISTENFTDRRGYNDYTNEAIEYLKNTDSSFYRVQKNYSSSRSIHGSLNDNQVQGYFGTSSYSSFNYIYYIRFLQQAGITSVADELSTRWATGVRDVPLLHGLASVKYTLMSPRFKISAQTLQVMNQNGVPVDVLSAIQPAVNEGSMQQSIFSEYLQRKLGLERYKQYESILLNTSVVSRIDYSQFGYIPIDTIENIQILKNDYALPFGFTYDKIILRSEHSKLPAFQRQIMMVKACIIEDSDSSDFALFEHLTAADSSAVYTWDDHRKNIDTHKEDTLQITKHERIYASFEGVITIDTPKVLFFSTPYHENWQASVDGKAAKIHIAQGGLMAVKLLEPGTHTVKMEYTLSENAFSSVSPVLFVLFLFAIVFYYRKDLTDKLINKAENNLAKEPK